MVSGKLVHLSDAEVCAVWLSLPVQPSGNGLEEGPLDGQRGRETSFFEGPATALLSAGRPHFRTRLRAAQGFLGYTVQRHFGAGQ